MTQYTGMDNFLLDVSQLKVEFGTGETAEKAVKGISFQIRPGEILGLVGESGSGKSVTALSLMRLLPPQAIVSGAIRLKEGSTTIDLLQATEEQLRSLRGSRLAMIFQEPMTSLNPLYTCGAQVTEMIEAHQSISRTETRQRVIRLFGQMALAEPEKIFGCYPHQLSGGQQQRVMIAMAAICGPRLLIADEPTTALDMTVQQSILELIINLQRESRLSVLFISHDLSVIAEIADRVLVMYRGELVEEGPVEQILHRPTHPYTRALIACRPPLDKKWNRLPVIADFMGQKGPGDDKTPEISFKSPPVEITESELSHTIRQLSALPPLLSVRDLQVWHPSHHNLFGRGGYWIKAVQEVSLDLHPGEMLGLVGESGCGKSTLCKAILGLIPVTGGEVLFKGEPLLGLSAAGMRRMRRYIQVVFQDPYSSLNPRITIGTAIEEPMIVHKLYTGQQIRKKRVIELLEKVGLEAESFGKYPHEFSGGQRQRICVARALALDPECIIFDEPVSALDISVQAQVLNLIMSLRTDFGFSCLFISHDLSVVRFMCDRIAVMQEGRIIETGNAITVCDHPRQEYTRKLINAIPGHQVIAV